jgi:hypothetical protein
MLDPVRQGTPCFARFRKNRRLRNVQSFAALSAPATDKKWGKGGDKQKREGGWGAAGPDKDLHVSRVCRVDERRG